MNRDETAANGSYLLTGATGFLGSHIMAGLLAQGHSVGIAGRSAGGESLQERIRRLLQWFGMERVMGRLEFFETDFLKARMGLDQAAYARLCGRSLPIIHCASDTSFAEKNRSRVLQSNVESLAEILNFACQSRTRCFHLVSSAYAAGAGIEECPEAPVHSATFNNVYEESKAHAEKIVSARCREARLPYTIIRPAIVYGDARTGKSLRFNALYFPVRSLLHIRDIYLSDLENNRGRKSGECGVQRMADGVLYLPIRIFIPHLGGINLIPVNYFTEAILSILEKPENEMVYHITSNQPENMARLVSYTERFLQLSGIEVVIGAAAADGMRNPPEELFDYFIKAYRPYIADKRFFLRENTDRATRGALPPDFSYEVFRRCMDFAVSADWGKKLLL